MLRGIYTAAVGMMARQTQQEIVSNNLANVNTAGFKHDRLFFRNTLDAISLINNDPQKPPVEEFRTDFSQGRLYKTDNPLDFAIEGDGFFVVEGPNGPLYTRNGHFVMNDSRELLTANGLPVLGENGPIVLPEGEFSVNHRGEILNQDNELINRFLVARFEGPQAALMKVGNSLFSQRGNAPDPEMVEAPVRQGYLESANVNIVEQMVEMIMVLRDFAHNQKTIQAQDDTLRRAVNDLGRI